MNTYEIRLVINRSAEGYTATLTDSGGQATDPFPLILPLGPAETGELRWYLEEFYDFVGAGDLVKAHRIEGKLKEWGRALFKALFGAEQGQEVYRNLMDAVEGGQAGLITLGSVEAEVLVQPWEMLRDPRGPLALRGVSVRRQLQGARPAGRYALGLPLRILLIVSRPVDGGFIDPRNSIPPVLDACDSLEGQVTVEFCDPPTLARLEELISQARREKRPYHIVHFDGHGTYLPLTGVGALLFEDEAAKADYVTGTRFGDLLARLQVPLVLLEACRGSSLSDRPVFGSLAPALLESGVGSVVAFSHSVHIQAARILVERFYRELAGGQSVGAALQEARAALRANPRRFLHLGPNAECIELQDWFIPQLYQVGSDPVLIPPGAAGEQRADRPRRRAAADLAGFPPEPQYRFHGRALELLEMERAFRKHHGVVVSGMGGMGKTALAREAAAWWLRTGRFERAVFISFEGKAGAERAVQLIGQAVEGDDFSRRSGDPRDPQGQRQTAVRRFHEERLLVVWDNFESTLPAFQEGEADGLMGFSPEERADLQALYRELVEGKPQGRLLVTCRPQTTGLAGIKEYPLEGLKRPDSLHLLAAALDVKGISIEREGYERHEIDALLDLLADHPLSIELIAPHLKELTPERIRADFGALLERFQNPDALEGRNQGLRASLEFSRRRLSPAAQAALPWLAWFEGGVFEAFWLAFAELEPAAWEAVRAELESTALLKVETDGIQVNNRPYLRFHPTLGYAARPEEVADREVVEERFIGVYLGVRRLAHDALRGRQPAAGMALMGREEANLRRALQRAFARGRREEVGRLADTLRDYLERAGRNRERDALTAWVHAHLPDDVLDAAACAATQDQAWTVFTQGRAQEAVGMVQALLRRLESESLAGGEDPAHQIALSYGYLGRILYHAGRPDLGLEPARQAVERFERLPGEAARGNLSVALGDLANAYTSLGRFDPALDAAERGLAINRELGREREVAAGLIQIASILLAAHRYPEAERRYGEALQAARAAGDLELQGATLQHQGILHDEQGHHDRAVELFKSAIALFQRSNAPGSEMQTCDLLATAERRRGELEAAEAWYARGRQLALGLNDRRQLAGTARNLGILYQQRAEGAADPAARRAWLDKAVASVAEGLAIFLEDQNQLEAAASYSQLGVLHRMRGDLAAAETNALQALQIFEPLDHPNVVHAYYNLAEIARACGDAAVAAAWQEKFEAKYAEIRRREQGEGGGGRVDEGQLAQYLLQLAQVCFQVRVQGAGLPPQVGEALAQLRAAPGPFPGVAAFLQAVADGQALPPLPEGLPGRMTEVLEALREAVLDRE